MTNRGRPWGMLLGGISRTLLVGIFLLAPGARSEVRPLVVVGASPIQIGSTGGTLAKEDAIEQGLLEGVLRVARDLLEEQAMTDLPESEPNPPELWPHPPAVPGLGEWAKNPSGGIDYSQTDPYSAPSTADPAAEPEMTGLEAEERAAALFRAAQMAQEAEQKRIREALGHEMVSYTKSFRIVEDQGERPALFTDEPDVATEYVVLLEVQVETDRVRARLEEAGLLRRLAESELTGIRIEILGLTHYLGYQAFLDLLRSDSVSAADVSPRHFSAGRLVIHVEGEWETDQLLERLKAASPENLTIEVAAAEPIANAARERRPTPWRETDGSDGSGPRPRTMVLRVDWGPLAPPVPPEPPEATSSAFES